MWVALKRAVLRVVTERDLSTFSADMTGQLDGPLGVDGASVARSTQTARGRRVLFLLGFTMLVFADLVLILCVCDSCSSSYVCHCCCDVCTPLLLHLHSPPKATNTEQYSTSDYNASYNCNDDIIDCRIMMHHITV